MKPRRTYSPEFRATCLDLVTAQMATASSREDAVVAVAAALAIPVTTLRNWVRADRGAARTDHLPADAELAVRELTRQVEVLRSAIRHAAHPDDTAIL